MTLEVQLPQSAATVSGTFAKRTRERGDRLKAPSRSASYWQASPMAMVFFVFFVLPLVVTLVVSFWRYNEYSIIPAFTPQNYLAIFDNCVSGLPKLCTTFGTYLSTLKFCVMVWAVTLVLGFTIAYFLAFHIRTLDHAACAGAGVHRFRFGRRKSSG